uniref:Uncharacterized protein n=1 Tax=Chromera velia CCMP2878 TaxID=1169474 RepID=A0A0G4F536_9ALVE|eukprot:Cvel_2775.t1-p1 / transcript=Cvel_2775.t1 / gene=Cvel_2775 / organism=Chromera_velia_CCMP2878 / gene_product=Protein NLRC5, putative / transcript_product=Protein NLRC5, putative / location=Cvel_scaffold111:105179-109067(-) / protein_length=635 / sequence_SO=supercontig / SO=protein_coding / is_pseudo=false
MEAVHSSPQAPVMGREGILGILLGHTKPSDQTISSLAQRKDSVGIAWTVLYLVKKEKVKTGMPVRYLDLSGCSLSKGKVFLLLESLPEGVEELTLCPSAVEEETLALLCQFFERKKGVRTLNFQKESIWPETASAFASLPEGLESLNVEGNELGQEGASVLADTWRKGKLRSVRCLNLKSTKLRSKDLALLCSAFKEAKPLAIEILSLCDSFDDEGLFALCEAISDSALPSLRELSLHGCDRLGERGVARLLGVVGEGKLAHLQSLDLEGVVVGEQVSGLVGVLRKSILPQLGRLNLMNTSLDEKGVRSVLDVWGSSGDGEPPPVETLSVSVNVMSTDIGPYLGSGKVKCLKHVKLMFFGGIAGDFFNAVVEASASPPFETLEVTLLGSDENADRVKLESLSKALKAGRLSCLRKIILVLGEGDRPEKAGLWNALGAVTLPILSDLIFANLYLTDSDLIALSESFLKGNFPKLKKLDLSNNEFGKKGFEAVMNGIRESPIALSELRHLKLDRLQIGEGMDALALVMKSGKIPNLEVLDLSRCDIGNQGMRALGEAVGAKDLPRLRHLDLSMNQIELEGLRSFLRFLGPNSLPSLAEFHIELNRDLTSDEIQEAFSEAEDEGKLRSLGPFGVIGMH